MNDLLDVFGDIHGQYDELVALLENLGYSPPGGAWAHPRRTVIFVRDLIDRGPKQVGIVELVRAIAGAGSARCILGNHEFNVIAWATENLDQPGEFLRPRKQKNRQQHAAWSLFGRLLSSAGVWIIQLKIPHRA